MRTIKLTTPHTKGSAVVRLQQAINRRAHGRPGAVHVKADGDYGRETAHAEATVAHLLGVLHAHDHARAQAVILHPSLRRPTELLRARRVLKAAQKREAAGHTGRKGAVALALSLARHKPPYTEHPYGSNTDGGGLIDKMEREVGIHAAPWCGAAARYIAFHGGGVVLSEDTRYCPSIEAHARAGTGGYLRWIPADRSQEAQPGDLVLFTEGGIAGHVETLVEPVAGGMAHDVGGNTSGEGVAGSQNEGGMLAERHRPLGGSFPVRGFAVPRY